MSQPSTNSTAYLKDSTFVNVEGDLYQSNHYHEDISGRRETNLRQLKAELGRLSSIFKTNTKTCTEGTRTRIRQEITGWITSQCSQTPHTGPAYWPDESQNPKILWINGAAGTGKTTLACTLAINCKEMGIPCACFFAYRGDIARSDPKRIIPVIAAELASYHKAFGVFFHERLEMCAAADEIFEWEIAYQMEQLVIGPLQECARQQNPFSPGVVLIDALDECLKDDESQSEELTIQVVTAIANNIQNLFPLRFIVTCRPEQRFLELFHQYERENILMKFVLHDDRWSTKSDIRIYLVRSLAALPLAKRAPASGWPSDDDIAELVIYSQNLFLIAETCLRFISAPEKQVVRALSELLKDIRSQDTSSLASFVPRTLGQPPSYSSINHLYNTVLNRTPLLLLDAEGRESFSKVLGTIVLSRIPLRALSIAKLLGFPDDYQVYNELRALHSVIIIPEDEKDDIRLLHQSFADFITDETRCHPDFLLDAKTHHMFLAQRCIDIWQVELEEECQPGWDPSKARSVVTQDKSHIRYAAQFWGEHLRKGSPKADHKIFDQILELCSSTHVKYWIEFCASRGILRSTLSNIRSVVHFLEKHGADSVNLNADLHEQLQTTEQWIRQYFTLLEEVPSQIYHLPYDPPLYTAIEESGDDISWIKQLTPNKGAGSSSKICRVEMNSVADICATFRRGEDDYILAGSATADLEVWDMLSGLRVDTIGPKSQITAMAVSDDGGFAICADEHGMAKIWDLRTKKVCGEAKMHKKYICAINVYGVVKLENLRIISADTTGRVIVWKFWNFEGRLTQVISEPKIKHGGSVSHVAFSPNGRFALSVWEDEETLFIWDVESKQEQRIDDVPAGVISAAFSPVIDDIPTFACGTSSGRMYLWRGGVYDAKWSGWGEEIDGGWIVRMCFSPNGRRIAGLLDIESEERKESRIIIAGVDDDFRRCIICPVDGVRALAFSKDGRHMVTTTSKRATMQVWREPTSDSPEIIDVRPFPVTCVEISTGANMVITGSRDGSFSLWSLQSGAAQRLPDFEGCLSGFSIRCAAFSADGKIVAIGLESLNPGRATRGAIYIIETLGHSRVQTTLRVLEVMDPVSMIVFSPLDSKILANTANQLSVEVRDIQQNLVVSKLEGIHQQAEMLADFAFSPDGTKIATANGDSKIVVWDIASGDGLWEYKFSRDSPDTIAFTSDGEGIVAMTQSRAIGLFGVKDGGLVTLIGGGAVASQKMGSKPPGIFSKLVATLWEYEAERLLGRDVSQQNFSSYNCKVLTNWIANLDRDRYVVRNEPVMIIQDGWLWCLVRRRRIMPIPESMRVDITRRSSLGQRGKYVAFGSAEGQVNILDITILLQQLDIQQ